MIAATALGGRCVNAAKQKNNSFKRCECVMIVQ